MGDQQFNRILWRIARMTPEEAERALTQAMDSLDPCDSSQLFAFFKTIRRLKTSHRHVSPLLEVLWELFAIVASISVDLPRPPATRWTTFPTMARLPWSIRTLQYARRWDAIFPFHYRNHRRFRRCLRLGLKKLETTLNESKKWAEPRIVDLLFLVTPHRRRVRLSFHASRWRSIFGAAVAKTAPKRLIKARSVPAASDPGFFWYSHGRRSLRLLEALIGLQAEEMRRIRRIVFEVSRRTRRVVLSCHNATLGAMGGWGFESLQMALGALYDEYERRSANLTQRQRDCGLDLLKHWQERVVKSRAEDFLWRFEATAAVIEALQKRETTYQGKRKGSIENPREKIGLRDFPEALKTNLQLRTTLAFPPALSPHQCPDPSEFFEDVETRRSTWSLGFSLLKLLCEKGWEDMRKGRLETFAFPWIHKFFVSSLREADGASLLALVDEVMRFDPPPILLFWDDTIHPQSPSLSLALTDLLKDRARGLGVFGNGRTANEEMIETVVRESDHTELFALNPMPHHSTLSFQQLMKTEGCCDSSHYDSAWKDNLDFVYTGTDVQFLTAPANDPEVYPGWILWRGRKLPFGFWLRRKLRSLVLGPDLNREPQGRLDATYARWAFLL